MRILTHTKSFLRFKLKLVTLVICGSIEIFSPNFVIFVTFYITQHYPPSVCPFTTNPLPPNVTGGGCGFRWGGGGYVGSGGGVEGCGFRWGGGGGGVCGFRWGGSCSDGGDQVERGGRWVVVVQVGGGVGGIFLQFEFRF